jgi:phage anti-repressor protein
MQGSVKMFTPDLAMQLVESSDQFPVDFDLAWQWAGYSRKDSAKRVLKKSGMLANSRFHRIVESAPLENGGSSPEKIWLSLDCFKHFAMMAQTEQGDAVRDYFLECERRAKAQAAPMDMLTLMEYSIHQLRLQAQDIAAIKEQNLLLVEQNQYLQTQVKLLTSAQEALELETEANAAELDRYRNGHGRYYTISAWCNLHGYTLSLKQMNLMGRKAGAMCRTQNIAPQPVKDTRWGTVGSYPDRILEELNFED